MLRLLRAVAGLILGTVVFAGLLFYLVVGNVAQRLEQPQVYEDRAIGVLARIPSRECGRTSWDGWRRNRTSPPGQYWIGCAPTTPNNSATAT
jgi:hypothetical protein